MKTKIRKKTMYFLKFCLGFVKKNIFVHNVKINLVMAQINCYNNSNSVSVQTYEEEEIEH